MKKFLLALVIVVCLAGLGVLGYVVFNAKSVKNIEIEGNAQTLYFINESSTPKFDDAKLKVTYKNGNIKYVNFSSSSVKITSFSTSVENHGSMTITYKSQSISLEYNVIKMGYYFVKEQKISIPQSNNSTTTTTSSIADAKTLLFLDEDGALKYYVYSSSKSAWLLYDGKYDSDFNWQISGNSLIINYQEDYVPRTEVITANYSNGEIVLNSTIDTKNDAGLVTKRVENTYGCNNSYKTNVSISSIDEDLYVLSGTTKVVESYNAIKLSLNGSIASEEMLIYFKVNYTSPIITFSENGKTINMLDSVYVMLTDEMISLETDAVRSTPKLTYLCYESYSQTSLKKYNIYYVVES